ncbi:aspartyl/asparaginyl beta-hydroxylase domain-containing protein [Nocardia sp. NPDC059195]|uniref:aspartyl/asparaginyl beta-hydroxylase domain-containing protein n=1 Tax=Nocardia sp. NPDC059195 TaxID=3346765 RepID=UPI0036B89A6E
MATTTVNQGSLQSQIACLDTIGTDVLERLRHEALTVPANWVVEYGKYQSGGWRTQSLLNGSGDPGDVKIGDCDPVPTTLLRRMPITRQFLDSLGLRYMWVRLAWLEPNSFLWEHRDYADLADIERHRLHLPLVTNSSAALVTGGARIHMAAGRLWRLAPTNVHGACNLLGPGRLHLIMDCYSDDTLARTVDREYLAPDDVALLPAAEPTELEDRVEQSRKLITLGYDRAGEQHLLRMFYERTVPEGRLYELIAAVYTSLGREADAQRWIDNKTVLLGSEPAEGTR